ncbi:hypothetical protein A9Q83_03295 [Alphaproteobacteria bacterium 46_93_T64]|nr:hypothetical protein A9Q83_03295 [Alphaproteobacteria bacterium 46_93_T64]
MVFEITATYAAALGILTAGLGFATVIMRAKSKVSWGDGGNLSLQRAIRAHGNLIEYMPIFLILLVILENSGTSAGWLHILGAVFLGGRLVSIIYFWISQKFSLRVIALWGAVLPIVAGSVLLLMPS